MTEFQYLDGGNTEAQDRLATSFLFKQSATPGKAAPGVLSGLDVAQTATASGSVQIGAGACVVQGSLVEGVALLVNDTLKSLDVLTANPVGSLPRYDVVAFDSLAKAITLIVGAANASPTDPTVPSTALALARLRHTANATTIPNDHIDKLAQYTTLLPPVGSSWIDFTPKLWTTNGSGAEVVAAGTAGLSRYRYLDSHTVQAIGSAQYTGASSGGARIDLPVTAAYRSLNCGTAGVFGPSAGFPASQSGVAYMTPDSAKLVCVHYNTAYLDAAAGNWFRYSVTYEV